MNVLFVASEVSPYSKTGGLADVSAALSKTLAQRGHDVLVVTPRYASVKLSSLPTAQHSMTLRFPFGEVTARLELHSVSARLRVLFVDIPAFFGRAGYYGENETAYDDNALRFGAFSVAALSAAQMLRFEADIVHLNDWQTALAALALKSGYRDSSLSSAKSVLTLHNLAYQGLFPPSVLWQLGISPGEFHMESLEFYGQVNFLKAGIAYADALTTVSPRYAQEILTPEGGHGLDGFLRAHASKLEGILNGVDLTEWNPAGDRHLKAQFSAAELNGKEVCKEDVLKTLGLPESRKPFPLLAVVSRLTHQKGIDWVLDILPRLIEANATVVLLGQGDAALEEAWLSAQTQHLEQVRACIGFDEKLSHQMEAGADFFLMPSRFEPCGLNQMYSMLYGTLPIVRATGGLDDTVIDLSMPHSTGIKFPESSAEGLWQAVQRALRLYAAPHALREVQQRAMACDFSWDRAAREYEALYQSLTL